MKLTTTYPHEGGCPCCREQGRCNVCGAQIQASTRCSNGRCLRCHDRVCTPGGIAGPGHGYGAPDRDALSNQTYGDEL